MRHLSIARTILIISFSLLLLAGCAHKWNFTLQGGLEGSALQNTAYNLSEFMNENGWELTVKEGTDANKNINNVSNKTVEFAIEPSNATNDSSSQNVRTVIPLFPNVGMILYRDTIQAESLQELLPTGKIAVTNLKFFQRLFEDFGLHVNTLSITDISSDNLDEMLYRIDSEGFEILCSFTPLNNPLLPTFLNNGWSLLSLAELEYIGKGSAVEGFCLNNPKYYPLTIPVGTFLNKPEKPVLTVANDVLLITNENIAGDVIYDFVKQIFEHKQLLVQKNVLFNWLTEDFDRGKLNYPLHEGAMKYLSRNQPSIFERYAELAGVLISFMIVAAGLLAGLRQRKKDRIDVYFLKVMNADTIEEIEEIESTVVNLMGREKIRADTTFSSFINFAQSRKDTIFRKKNR